MNLVLALNVVALAAVVLILAGAVLIFATAFIRLLNAQNDVAHHRGALVAVREAQAEELAAAAAEVAPSRTQLVERPAFADAELDTPPRSNGRQKSAEDWEDPSRPEYAEERMGGGMNGR